MWINKLIYFAVLLYAGLLALLYTKVQCLYIFFILVIFGGIQWVIVRMLKQRVTVSLKAGSSISSVSDAIDCVLTVKNDSFFPISCVKLIISYENSYEHIKQYQNFHISMNARTTQDIMFRMTSEHVGTIEIEVKKVHLYDYLRIFSSTLKNVGSGKITVYPDICEMDSEVANYYRDLIDSEVYSKVKSGDDPSEVFDIREYKEGDKIHRIHWKLSSKRDAVLVKEYSLPIACSVGIIVNVAIPGSLEEKLVYWDALMTTIASVSYHLLINEQLHYIAWYEQAKEDYECVSIDSVESLYMALHGLLEVKADYDKNEILEVHKALKQENEAGKIYYMTGIQSEEEKMLLELEYANVEVSTIAIVEEEKLNQKEFETTGQYVGTNHYRENIQALLL